MKIFVVVFIFLILLSGCQTTSKEQMQITQPVIRCAPAIDITVHLRNKYNEIPRYAGMTSSGIVMVIYISTKNTFTVVHTTKEVACLSMHGTEFHKINWKEFKKI
tara:strand:+ start:139 stop:453 length:315 start_codon:yes stop_codon:yes gene_type:complete